MENYDKYLNRENSPIPAVNLEILNKGEDMPSQETLHIAEKNLFLEEGYVGTENGFHHFEDGSVYVAVLTEMPKVTIEMIDWWFWWHAKEPVRYRIWYPEMHFDNSSDFGGYYNDESKSYRERLHLSTHFVTEDIGTGKEEIVINFMSPEAFGFEKSMLKSEKEQTIICAKVGDMGKGVWHTKMCHAVRKVDKGVEMRSRFWIGHKVERMGGFGQKALNFLLNKPFIKRNLIPENLGKHMFHHCTQEYNNLGDVLPEVYKSDSTDETQNDSTIR